MNTPEVDLDGDTVTGWIRDCVWVADMAAARGDRALYLAALRELRDLRELQASRAAAGPQRTGRV